MLSQVHAEQFVVANAIQHGETEFSLSVLAKSQLGETRKEMKIEEIEDSYSNKKKLQDCMEHARTDAVITLKLMFHLSRETSSPFHYLM